MVHVHDEAPSTPSTMIAAPLWTGGMLTEAYRRRATTQLERLADGPLKGVAHTTDLVQSSSVSLAICDYAREHNADLIVVSTHGRTGLARMLIGSVAEQVVRHAPCAVLGGARRRGATTAEQAAGVHGLLSGGRAGRDAGRGGEP